MTALRGQGTPQDRSEAGFTLLEALAATMLMSMILAALATITAQWLPSWNRGMTRVQESDRIALALDRIVTDLAATEIVLALNDPRYPVFDGTDRSVVFLRTALGANAAPGLDLVQISMIDANGGNALVRSRAPFLPMTIVGTTRRQPIFADPVVLLRGSYRLSFMYAGIDRVWHSQWRSQSDLPRTIKINLLDLTAQRTPSLSMAVAGSAKAPIDCLLAKSLTDCHAARQAAATGEAKKAQ
jgi:general secretion pathway protein J